MPESGCAAELSCNSFELQLPILSLLKSVSVERLRFWIGIRKFLILVNGSKTIRDTKIDNNCLLCRFRYIDGENH